MMAVLGPLLFLFVVMPVHSQPEIQLGEWNGWGPWSSCSRTCGGGITYQERTCGPTGTCLGESKNINSCNIQDCPSSAGDFRAEQCTQYNTVPHNGTQFEWVPYLGSSLSNKCALHCRAKGFYFYKTFKDRVVDGTRCDQNTYDMCVDGVCKKAGCDLIIGSDAKEDECRVCNGGGENCRTVKGVYTTKHDQFGDYIDIMMIPAGARNVLIKDDTRNYLALKDSSYSYILNGNMMIMPGIKVKAAGTTIQYKEKGEKTDYMTVLGPTTDHLYVTLLVYMDSNVSVSYEYYIPKSHKVVNHKINYEWQTEQYGACNKDCNGGVKTRKVFCVRSRDNAAMKDHQCDAGTRPEESTACNTNPCPPRWFVGIWGPCSKTCEEGSQVRRVHCEQVTKNGLGMVNDNLCPGFKVIAQRKCTEMAECPKWALGEWSQCSQSCGGGLRTRKVNCREMVHNNAIEDDKCPLYNRPRDTEPCGETPCNVRWVIWEWGECHPQCGQGMRARTVYCGSTTNEQRRYPDYMCDTNNKPKMTKECVNTQECPPMWYASSWSKCAARCGKGMQMRNVFCGIKRSAKFVEILPNERCSSLPMMKKMQHCKTKPCYTQWVVSEWGKCLCEQNKRLREVRCYADTEEDKTGKACEQEPKPPTEDMCNQVDCKPTTGSNRFTRHAPTKHPEGPQVITSDPPKPQPVTHVPTTPTTTTELPVTTLELTQPPTTTKRPTRPPVETERPTRPPVETERPTRPPVTTKRPTRPPVTTGRPTRPVITKITTERPSTTETPITTTYYPPTNIIPETNNGHDGMSKRAEVVRGPLSVAAYVGSDVTLSCVATGNPKPTIFWIKGNVDISIFGQRYQILPDGALRIRAVQKVDESNYTCIATNGYMVPQRSAPADLTVETPPYVDITLGYTVKTGNEARIRCEVSGTPRPKVKWYKDGRILKQQDTDRATVTPEIIIIRRAELQDGGKYKCKATNKNGERTAQMMLDVLIDKQTTLDKMKSSECIDMPTFANCTMVKNIEGYCNKDFYMNVCCESCKKKLNLM